MSGTPITESDLLAYGDGRLTASRREELARYLASNPEAEERVAEYARQNALLRELYAPVLAEPVPQRMVMAAQRVQRNRVMAFAAGWAAIGAFVGLLAGGVGGWSLRAPVQPVASGVTAPLVKSAAIAHATYSPEVRHPVEVGVDQEAHLVAWLSKRLGAPVRAPKLDAQGLALVGGRLLPGESGHAGQAAPTAQFMYQSQRGRRVTLYVRAETQDRGETAFRYAREGNIGIFYWIDRRFGYALSSADMEREELLALANLAYRQLNP